MKKRAPKFFRLSLFNEARYRALLEGLEITELKLSEILSDNEVSRFDPEYFGKEVLRVPELLGKRKSVRLREVAEITDGIHASLPFIKNGPVKVLSARASKRKLHR